jgi:hypothetical protein
MPRITLQDAKAWTEKTKLAIGDFDDALLEHSENVIIGRLNGTFDTTTWLDEATTPDLIRTIISMRYVASLYRRSYADDAENPSSYPFWLEQQLADLLEGLLDGTIDLPELPANSTGTIGFYPTDASSAMEPTSYDSSLGPNTFSMGQAF